MISQYNIRRDMDNISTEFKFINGASENNHLHAIYLMDEEKKMRSQILHYYDICMSEEYEIFNYVKTLIKKNKFNKIDFDVCETHIGKYIKKHEFTYKPNHLIKRSNIWHIDSFDLKEFYLNKMREQFPECSPYLRMDLDCITKFDQNGIDMVQKYSKSEEYKKDRRFKIQRTKMKTNIVDLKKRYAENEYQLAHILDRVIDIYETLRNFGEVAEIGENFDLEWYDDDEVDFKNCMLRFKNCNKTIKIYKFVKKYVGENGAYKYVSYFDNNIEQVHVKPFYSFRKYTQNNPPEKLERIINSHIDDNEFSIGGRRCIAPESIWRINRATELKQLHLYKRTCKAYHFLEMQY